MKHHGERRTRLKRLTLDALAYITERMDEMDGGHGAWLAKQLTGRSSIDAMKRGCQKGLEVEQFALIDYCKGMT